MERGAPGDPTVLFCIEGQAGEPLLGARSGVAQGYLSKVSQMTMAGTRVAFLRWPRWR